MMKGEYNPKSKGRLQSSWRGLRHRFPKTLSTFQLAVIAGFLSLLILRSTMGVGKISFAGHNVPRVHDEGADSNRGDTDLDVGDGEPKRNLVQEAEHQIEKLQQLTRTKVKETFVGGDRDQVIKTKTDPKPSDTAKKLSDQTELPDARTGKNVKKSNSVERKDKDAKEIKGLKDAKEAKDLKDVKDVQDVKDVKDVKSARVEHTHREDPAKEQQRLRDELRANGLSVNLPEAKSGGNVSGTEESAADTGDKPEEEEQPVLISKEEAMTRMKEAIRRDQPNPFTLGPKITDWDQQRAEWMDKHPDMRTTDPHKPRVLLLTGSQPWPCVSPIGDHYLLKMIKNKVDYARIHKMEIFYNLAHLDRPMSHFWAKLPLIRKMMLIHPETEWIFWMDSDAMFTDMVFEVPFEKYGKYNLVMWGYDHGLYEEKSWVACNTGVFFLRNNQWTLDLLERWSHMGPEGIIRTETGEIMSSFLSRRPHNMMADDQSALVYLMLTDPSINPKIRLEWDFWLSGYWKDIVGNYEGYLQKSRPGAGGKDWPFTTHFTGCQPCTGASNEAYEGNSCTEGMERAFNFADNQVLRPFGFEHESLKGHVVKRIRNETTQPLGTVPIHNPWAVDSFYS